MHPNLLTGFLKNPESEIRLENKFGSGVGAAVGAHTEQVLQELGYDAERIAALREARVFG